MTRRARGTPTYWLKGKISTDQGAEKRGKEIIWGKRAFLNAEGKGANVDPVENFKRRENNLFRGKEATVFSG